MVVPPGVIPSALDAGWRPWCSVAMKQTVGLSALLMVLAIGAWIYSKQVTAISPSGASVSPRATVDIAGVQNDLVAIANAERRHLASEGKYVSLDELISGGDITLPSKRRGPYHYDVDVTDTTFRITAAFEASSDQPAPEGAPRIINIDSTMQITREP